MEIRFKLNPKNEKDKVIIDVLSGEYSPSEAIKNMLYKMGTNGVEGQQMSLGGQADVVNVSTETDGNPKFDDIRSEMDKASDGNKCQGIEDEDIAVYFCN